MTASIWALRSLQDQTVPRSRREAVTLRLSSDHGITGTASCNDVGGKELTWAASNDTEGTIVRDPGQPTIMTVVGCNDVAAAETAGRFWELMTGARAWAIDRGDLVNALRIGHQGEIRDLTTEGQHYRIAGLNLLTAIIVYWNTLHLGHAVEAKRREGLDTPDHLLAHVSPLGWAHILLIRP